MRLAVYTDYSYVAEGRRIYADRAFAVFLTRLATRFEGFTLIGRLRPGAAELARYPIPQAIGFVGLPYYESLTRPLPVLRAMAGSLRRFWRALDEVDAVWLLGPHPLAIAFALLARLRRRRVLLGVRQDTCAYVRARHPGRRAVHAVADALDRAYAALARRTPTIVVGPALRERFGHARALLELTVSLIEPGDVIGEEAALDRDYGGELRIISVGRIEEEKNPLMLAEVLAALEAGGEGRWRLVVCGEGPLSEALGDRFERLGLGDRAELLGYVKGGEAMREAYLSSHFLLHTSWTEGLPQVLIEAFAAGLPAVATDVGGIRAAVGEAAALVPAGDVAAAAATLRELAGDAEARGRLIRAALAHARAHTIDAEVARLADFIAAEAGSG